MKKSFGTHNNKLTYKILPYPAGKEFAFTFIDDTDLSTKENTEPVYDFLHKKGITGTKTVWVTPQKRTSAYRTELEKPAARPEAAGSTLDNPIYREYVIRLRDMGFEIALHGISAGNSYRREIIDGLEQYKEIIGKYPDINIFHERNIDNLYAGYEKLETWPLKLLEKLLHNSDYQGHRENSPYFWGDIAREKIRYMRLPFHNIAEINTLKINPGMPFHDPRRHYVNYWFTNSDAADCDRFKSLLKSDNIIRLKDEFGTCIAYTHFAKGFAKKDHNGVFELDPGFRETIEYLAGQGGVWFPVVTTLLNRLLQCRKIELHHNGNELVISNTGDATLNSLCIAVNRKINITDTGGSKVTQSERNILEFVNIPPRSRTVYSTDIPGSGIHLRAKIDDTISYRERIGIELHNYYGMIKQDVLKM